MNLNGGEGSRDPSSRTNNKGVTKTTPTLTLLPKDMSPAMNATSARYNNNSQDDELAGMQPLSTITDKHDKQDYNRLKSSEKNEYEYVN